MAKIEEEVLNILDRCRMEGNVVFLPQQLDRQFYVKVNKCLESIGGKWNRKEKGHVFEEDPEDLLGGMILSGEMVDWRKEFQFFETPKALALEMIAMADIGDKRILLEPSAGKGAISDYFPRNKNRIVLVELNSKNSDFLREKGYAEVVLCKDFLKVIGHVDRVVMNPPFSKQQDIDHILHAYELLNPGGVLVSVVSEGPFFRSNTKSGTFRDFLYSTNAYIQTNPDGTFSVSGTKVRTRLIKIKR